MKDIDIFGKKITVDEYLCGPTKESKLKGEPSIRLYIKINDECNCKCRFCVNQNNCDYGKIDFKRLEYVIRYLVDGKVLHSIGITGGEPMLYPEKLNKLVNLIYHIDPEIEVQINTNGTNLLEFLNFDNINKLESIHISRHHYNDNINNYIFGCNNIAKSSDIMKLQENLFDKKIININTMVMKNYIDSLQEIKKMLNYVGDIGVYKNGFVSLIKCNKYAKENFINFNNIFNSLDLNFYLGHHFYKHNDCECIDGIYLTNNYKLVEFYARMIKNSISNYTNCLVYTTDNRLTDGFTNKVLYK